ncbi:hypothetical protein I3842_12G056300 [Carya illinoinensis]|uniref:EndoU domain-containing protein n=1 Tax=Carya illinoinensis TaxID=32201 RepID=A0A922IV70_CARIL|nr:hypothetical protein I3842_12G056300 [Carya illinoinensis]
MEGLFKGLIDVALGHDSKDEEEEERSRSTWAQDVSGSRPSRRPQKTVHEGQEKVEDENDEEKNGGWKTVGEKPRKRPHKQEYSDEVENGAYLEPTEEELADLSQSCNKLWELDMNRLVPGKDYEIDCGDGKKVFQKEDMAQGSLFSWVNENIFQRRTFSRFCSLLDNYNPDEGQEQSSFIEEISRTAPVKYLHNMMTSLWFDLYGRGGTSGSSSAFEHVFVGEIKQRGEEEVSGFHNWLQFYLEEDKGRVDYQDINICIYPQEYCIFLTSSCSTRLLSALQLSNGYIKYPDSDTQLLTIQFEWNGVLKSVSSTLVGVSPEFEIALYTLCFYMGGEDNHTQLGPYPVNIKSYHLGDRIGSAFPVAKC